MNIIGLTRIPDEINFHGKAIESEIHNASIVIDQNGADIQKEMQLMRETFEKEMKILAKKTRNTVLTVVAINIASRIFLK